MFEEMRCGTATTD